MGPINLNTTDTLLGAVKLIIRLTFLGWKPSWMNHTLTPLNTVTVKVITRQILIFFFSGNTSLIANSILKSTKKFMILENN